MSLRSAPQPSKPVAALDYEIAQEQASALGRLGRALEAALAALVEYDRVHREPTAKRAQLVQDAGDALWCFMVQREACGLRDPQAGATRLPRPRRSAKPHGRLRRPAPHRLDLSFDPPASHRQSCTRLPRQIRR